MYEIAFDKLGKHQLGGEIPDGFEIPKNEFKGGFQYLGLINNSDNIFSWLPFELNLICPIFLDFDFIFLDYENPNQPKLLHPLNTSEIETAYDNLNPDSVIIYKAKRFSFTDFDGVTEENELDNIGFAGRPHWTQNKEVPICPKSNKKMKFVCQLTSWSELKTKFTNVVCDSEYEQQLIEKLNFWEDRDLYVFMEPEFKTVCYFIQST